MGTGQGGISEGLQEGAGIRGALALAVSRSVLGPTALVLSSPWLPSWWPWASWGVEMPRCCNFRGPVRVPRLHGCAWQVALWQGEQPQELEELGQPQVFSGWEALEY